MNKRKTEEDKTAFGVEQQDPVKCNATRHHKTDLRDTQRRFVPTLSTNVTCERSSYSASVKD